MIEQGTPVKLPDGRVGNVIGYLDNSKVRVRVSKEEPKHEGSQRIVARLEEVEVPEKELLTDFVEHNEHTRKNGTKFYTNQHGEVVK